MERQIIRFTQDGEGDWFATLSCGHTQHIRHKPPFQNYPWVMTQEGRASKVGEMLNCSLCDEKSNPCARP